MPRRFGFGLGFNISRLSGLPEPSGFVAKYQAYDVDDFTLVTGSNVSQWDDRSANSNHLTQGTSSNQPVLTQGADQFNNKVDFGTDDYMEGLPPQSGDFTYVFKGLNYDLATSFASLLSDTQGSSSQFFYQTDSLERWVIQADDGTQEYVTTSIVNYDTIVLMLSGTTLSLFGNGTLIGNFSTSYNKVLNFVNVGRHASSFNGSLQELYVYDRALTQDEINWFSYLRDSNNNISPLPPILPS